MTSLKVALACLTSTETVKEVLARMFDEEEEWEEDSEDEEEWEEEEW